MTYVVVVASDEAKFIATVQREGLVEATSRRFRGDIPVAAKTFETVEDAEKFAERWLRHPRWRNPSGEYAIIEVTPRYRKVLDGFDAIATACKSSTSVSG